MKKVYLAGPDVFFPDADAHFDALEALCAKHGLQGVRPSDGGLSRGLKGTGDEVSERIYQANVDYIRECDAVLANLQPFRNALEPDSGTVFEIGFAVALGKPVAGLLPDMSTFESRVIAHCGVQPTAGGPAFDATHGMMIEQFSQPMNLMLARSSALFDDLDAALAHLAAALKAA